MPVTHHVIFGQEDFSRHCPRCRNVKVIYFNLWNEMQGTLYPLLIDLHANAHLGILYDSRPEKKVTEKGFEELVSTSNTYQLRHENDFFKFDIMKGARQVKFNF